MNRVLVLSDHGDPVSGETWFDAFLSVGFDSVIVPDLAGSVDQGAPVGGNYTRLDPIYEVARQVVAGNELTADELRECLLVGVGSSGWAALVLALAGHGNGLVLVDGIGAPWMDGADRGRQRRHRLRAIADDPAAMAPTPTAGPDPRLGHHRQPHGDRGAVVRAAAAIEVPALLVDTHVTAAEEVAGAFGGGATVRPRPATPNGVAELARDWST